MKSFAIYAGGVASGLLFAAVVVLGLLLTNVLVVNPEITGSATHQAPTIEAPADKETPIEPVDQNTSTPIPACWTHPNGYSLKISFSQNVFTIKSTAPCHMMRQYKQGDQPVIGTHVRQPITINNVTYQEYWEYTIPMQADRQAIKGIYMELYADYEFDGNGFGWTEEHPKTGDFWYLMKYEHQATPTPTPGG